jgi:hypothetical protein
MNLILMAHPRSGSTSLNRVLDLHPKLNILMEPFNENFTNWAPGNKDYLSLIHDDVPSLKAQLAEIFATYNGIKTLGYQLSDAQNTYLLQRPDCRVILLRRKNVLKAVVSVLISEQTNLWHKWDARQPLAEYYRNLQPLGIADIQTRIRELNALADFLERMVEARPDQRYIKLTYEAFYFAPVTEQERVMTAIWQLLELEPLPRSQYEHFLRPEEMTMNSAETYALVPNIAEIEAACGSDATGWLFR